MEEIAAGKGRAQAVHDRQAAGGRCSLAKQQEGRRRQGRPAESKARPRKVGKMPDFVEPQLCKLVERPPSQAGWAHEIKFDGYRMQLRVEDGKAR